MKTAASIRWSWRTIALPVDCGSAPHNRVEPTTSVNRNVTAPDGNPTTPTNLTHQPAWCRKLLADHRAALRLRGSVTSPTVTVSAGEQSPYPTARDALLIDPHRPEGGAMPTKKTSKKITPTNPAAAADAAPADEAKTSDAERKTASAGCRLRKTARKTALGNG